MRTPIGIAMFTIAHLSTFADVKGTAHIRLDKVDLLCDRGSTQLSGLQPLNRTTFRSVTIYFCSPPTVSYSVELQRLNVEIATLKFLTLVAMPPQPELREDHFTGLNLRHLIIEPNGTFLQPSAKLVYNFSDSFNPSSHVNLSEGTRISLTCESNNFDRGVPTMLPNRSVMVNEMKVTYCPPPTNYSYAAVLQALNINVTAVEKLELNDIHNPSMLRATHFSGLSLRELTINLYNFRGLESSRSRLDDDLLEPLVISLKKLQVSRVEFPPLSNSSQLTNISLDEGASLGSFGGCSKLRELSVTRWQLPELTGGWLEHCPKLDKLVLAQITEKTLQLALTGLRSVTSLVIQECSITHISGELLADAVGLQNLWIYGHRLYSIHWAAFKSQSLLKNLNLGSNSLTDIENLAQALQSVGTLRNLSLESNHEIDYCNMVDSNNMSSLISLERLDLRGTRVTRLCFSDMHMLSYIDLSITNITSLKFQELPSPLDHSLEVILRSTYPIHDLQFSEKDYHAMVKKFKHAHNVIVAMELNVDCDCQQAWFARALRALPRLSMAGVRCSGGGERLSSVPPERLECDKYACERCECRRAWRDNATDVDCRGAHLCTMPHLSQMPNLRKFLAPRNVIKPLRAEDFVKTLMEVDLRFNHISYVDVETAAALFATPGRFVALSGNPLVCDCENQPLIAALQEHRAQVIDFKNVTCVGEGRWADAQAVGDVVASELCAAARQRSLLALAAAGGALLALAALAGALYRCYGRELRIFLYAHGWCLCCVRDEPDAERPYDAFISFAHEDDEFVATELLPTLEAEFRLCVHTRNWVPGEMIATQIVRSVEQSRRTIVVLSQSFARSVWGMMEFRTAHVSALREGRVRVVLVVLDDVLQQPGLDAELRRYLRTNTYLRWGDPSFWERLRYALPRRRGGPQLAKPVAREPKDQPASMEHTMMLAYPLPSAGNEI